MTDQTPPTAPDPSRYDRFIWEPGDVEFVEPTDEAIAGLPPARPASGRPSPGEQDINNPGAEASLPDRLDDSEH